MNCIIVHGCPLDDSEEREKTYAKHWMPWVKKELVKRGIETETPPMPEPWLPDYKKFRKAFEKYKVDEDTILIGHSCGSAFLVHWLGDTKQAVKKLILVAPWKIADEDEKYRREFYKYPIDRTIKDRVGTIVLFTSDNEESDGKKSLEIFHEALGGKIIELKNHGHFTIGDMMTEEFPELLKEI